MTLKMNQEGEKASVVEAPTYIVTPSDSAMSSGSSGRNGITKKHVMIGGGVIVLTGLIIGGILGGMYIFAQAQKDIVRFSLDFKSSSDGGKVNQDVESDPNANVVMYHVTKDGKNVVIVNDFNRDMQVVKMVTESGTNCYVSALNRTAAVDPSQINAPGSTQMEDTKKSMSTIYTMSSSPISDRSFLPKKAQEMCKGVSVYWVYRGCSGQANNNPGMNNTELDTRQRRAIYSAGYYGSYPCLNGCCYTVCACSIQIVEYRIGTLLYCEYYVGSQCPNYRKIYQATPGVYC